MDLGIGGYFDKKKLLIFNQTFNQCLSSNALCKATLLPLVEVSSNQNGEQEGVQLPNEVKLA